MRFGQYLTEAIARKGLSQRAFARMVKYAQPALNRILADQRPPPLDQIIAWAKVLEGQIDEAIFVELAELEHTPAGIRKALEEARSQLKGREKT